MNLKISDVVWSQEIFIIFFSVKDRTLANSQKRVLFKKGSSCHTLNDIHLLDYSYLFMRDDPNRPMV
jgi:hypothetical protein